MFPEEIQFFKNKTGIELPPYCWRTGSKIYLDFTKKDPYYTFKVSEGKIKTKKDNRNKQEVLSQCCIDDLINQNIDRIDHMYQSSVEQLIETIIEHPHHFYIVGYSGGKDSELILHMWNQALERIREKHKEIYNQLDWVINFSNTSNDTFDTYRRIKNLPQNRVNILNPKVGFYPWIEKIKKYQTPTVLRRNCCSTYKEGQIQKYYDTKRPTINILGVRRYESTKRAQYSYFMDYDTIVSIFPNTTTPRTWAICAPAIDFKDEEVWLYLLAHKLDFNRQYRLGFSRCGCLICPYQTGYTDLLIEYWYPNMWDRWKKILTKGYYLNHIQSNFKWELDEWINGQWKEGKSKERYIIQRNPTQQRVEELAKLKGISTNMARKYFQRTCRTCGKKLNPTEIAFFYKTEGREEDNPNDAREIQCRKCYCAEHKITSRQYTQMVLDFVDSGCNLF